MAYKYRLTPGLKSLVDAAKENGGLLYRSQVKQIVSNDRTSFYKLERLGYSVIKKPIGETGKNYCVLISPPSGAWNFEQWFFEKTTLATRLFIYALLVFGFLMIAKIISKLV